MDEGNHQLGTTNEIDHQINEIIERNDCVWRCKICGKTGARKDNIRGNAELHIEGISYGCHICNKILLPLKPWWQNSKKVKWYEIFEPISSKHQIPEILELLTFKCENYHTI